MDVTAAVDQHLPVNFHGHTAEFIPAPVNRLVAVQWLPVNFVCCCANKLLKSWHQVLHDSGPGQKVNSTQCFFEMFVAKTQICVKPLACQDGLQVFCSALMAAKCTPGGLYTAR